jgi:hypothetical protein
MPNQLLCPQQSRNVQTPSHDITSNCLTRFVSMTWLFHNQDENSSEGLRLGFVLSPLFTFLNEKCLFLKLPRWLRLFSPATYRTKRTLFSKFSISLMTDPFFLIICNQ